MAHVVVIAVQLAGSSTWTNLVTDTVAIEQLRIDRGIPGNRPDDCLAKSGTCSFTLRNDAGNSGTTQGWYSPIHASVRTGWTYDIALRVYSSYESSVSVSTITYIGNTATVTTGSAHGWDTGDWVEISGATPTSLNDLFEITVTGATTFTFSAGLPHLLSPSSAMVYRTWGVGSSHAPVQASQRPTASQSFITRGRGRVIPSAATGGATIGQKSATGTITAQRVYPLFRGKIDTIDPEPGRYRSQRVHVTAYDTMRDIIDSDVRDVSLQIDSNESVVMGVVLDALPAASRPVSRTMDSGVDRLQYALDDIGGGAKAGSILADLCRSSYGLGFTTGAGVFRYMNRNTRATTASVASFSNTMHGLKAPSSLANVYNDIWITVHPKSVDSSVVTLYDQEGEPQPVPANGSLVFVGSFRDPNNSRRLIGGTSIIQPVQSTDYAANDQEDGLGTDMTSSVLVSVAPRGSEFRLTAINTTSTPVWLVNGSGDAFLKVRGFGVYDNSALTMHASSGRENRTYKADLPYQGDSIIGLQIAQFILTQYDNPANQVESLTILASESNTLLRQGLDREIGDVITITETMTGLSSVEAMILSVEHNIGPGNVLTTTWGLGPVVSINPPSAPSSLSVTVTSDENVNLTWTTGQVGAWTQIFVDDVHVSTAGIGGESFAITGLTTAATYSFKVRHIYFGLSSSFSNTATARPVVAASGGTETTPGDGYKYHTFTTSGTFTITVRGHLDVLLVAGGGGGGGADTVGGSGNQGGGGGGAGGVRTLLDEDEPTGAMAIVIGAGGTFGVTSGGGGGTNGTNGNTTSYRSETVDGGGYGGGGGTSNAGNNGGSGGGGSGNGSGPGGTPTSGQGNAGGAGTNNPGGSSGGGGGGGKGTAGGNASGSAGGLAGQGATQFDSQEYGRGGYGGGSSLGVVGRANKGDGGGGATVGVNGSSGYAGSDGVVVIRYKV